MERFIQVLSLLCLIFTVFSAELPYEFSNEEYTVNHTYDLKNLIRNSLSRYQNVHRFRSQPIYLQFEPVSKNILPDLLENELGNFTKCFQDLLYVAENLGSTSDQWAIKMLDSYGKLDSGILQGSLKWVGEYTECIEIYAPPKRNSTTGNFNGQYCSLAWSIEASNLSLAMTSGVCLPDTCLASEVQQNVARLLHPIVDFLHMNGTVNVTSFTCKPNGKKLNAPAIAVIALMSIFCALAILGSSVTAVKYFLEKTKDSSRRSSLIVNVTSSDWVGDHDERMYRNADSDDELLIAHGSSQQKCYGFLKTFEPFLECFCIFHNGSKILNTEGGEGELLCIHGIRFLSMSWVILGHAYAFSFTSVRNIAEAVESMKYFSFQIILQGFFSVDSFFILSGFLLTYLYLREYTKNKEGISWPYFYIHRYLRLTPVYMIVLGFSTTVYLYLGSGPFWPDVDVEPVCKDNWWRNLLYINNFSDMTNLCMGWSWYLANDMQFFIISPIFLITLSRWPKIGYSLVAIFLCACWLANFFITYHFDLVAGAANILDIPVEEIMNVMAKFLDYFKDLYIKPYTRIAPYLIGMITGHILFVRKQANWPKHSRTVLSVGWIIASTITLVTVYGLYHSEPSLLARSFYNALSRTAYAIGLSWVIYVCLVEQGGPVNSILSFKMFIPLSRLTYSAYLIHPLIITGYYSNLKELVEFSHPTIVIIFLGAMVVTYALSLPVALVFESPIIALEKLIRRSFSKKEEKCNQ